MIIRKVFRWLGCLGTIILLFTGITTVIVVGAMQNKVESKKAEQENSITNFSIEVESYREKVKEMTLNTPIEQYVENMLAIMEISTGGQGTDVMLASRFDSNVTYQNQSIQNAEYSIQCAIAEFTELINAVQVSGTDDIEKLKLVYQAYHIGRGYIEYSGGAYSVESATAYIEQNGISNRYADFAEKVTTILTGVSSTGTFIYPLPNNRILSSPYGHRKDPFTSEIKFHNGLDFPAPKGTPVHASADGVITRAGFYANGFGVQVKIQHTANLTSLYAHMNELNIGIVEGKTVKQGDVIGFVGTTGASTGYHLHFTIYKGSETVDPLEYLGADLNLEE